jgi:carbon storage regulator
MLVLSRKLGEQIVLPDCDVTVTVLGVSGRRVRLGVVAPPSTPVHRRETWEKIMDFQARDALDCKAGGNEPGYYDEASPPSEDDADGPPAPTRLGLQPCRLADHIRRQVDGRIQGLRVEADGDQVIISGRTSSYYARQLAEVAARDFLRDAAPVDAARDVTFNIEVAWP